MPDNKDELKREIGKILGDRVQVGVHHYFRAKGVRKKLLQLFNAYNRNQLKSLKAKLPEKVLKKPDPPHHKNKYPVRACISHNFKNFRCTNCGGIQASYDTGLDDKQIGRNEVIDQVNKILDEMIGE